MPVFPMRNTAPAIIHTLVETFEKYLSEYHSSKNETELRREFLDKFFTALGWDVDNLQGAREAEKEVAHEYSVEIDGQQKKADYAFRLKRDSAAAEKFDFLVEAKKPSVKIETDVDAAFQIRRYGWSARIPINILTDFEHLAVYDCRVKPKYGEKAVLNRQALFHYKDYAEKWDEIARLFSPAAIRAGSLSEYAKSIKGKRGTADVDADFLQEIERWRELLAKNIAANNAWIDIGGLNYAVQMIIDRIIFLRICEERSIEPENQLHGIANKAQIYKELCLLFKRADTKYNSGLFHFAEESAQASRADDLTLRLQIDAKPLKDIILNLYYPKSPYAFLYIPSDILGQVYERFLGKVIRLTDGHRAKVEDKPEVRKAGGVFYTPTFIVAYIVANTLGKLLPGLHPQAAAGLKIVDPACGSGTFLLGAFDCLLAWHLKWYADADNDPEKWVKNKALVKVGDDYRLTTAKKKEILLNNIYGVDIDAQAVEVTKLSLLLKVLENASGQLELGMERILPDLGNNIKCGNSLVGEDYFEGKLMVDNEERNRVNPFEWKSAFPEVFAQGGFDVVIGNPPYVLLQSLNQPEVFNYFSKYYRSAKYKIDTYQLFLEKSLAITRQNGYLSFITPNTFLSNKFSVELRRLILNKSNIKLLRIFYYAVFKDASVDTSVIVLERSDSPIHSEPVKIVRSLNPSEDQFLLQDSQKWLNHTENFFTLPSSEGTDDLTGKIQSCSVLLGEFATAYFGIQTFDRTAYVKPTAINRSFKPVIDGGNISRFSLSPSIEFVDFRPDAIKSGGKQIVYEQERIGVRQIGKVPVASIMPAGICTLNTIYNIFFTSETKFDLKFILGIILSKSLGWYWQQFFFDQKQIFPKVKKDALLSIPIPKINFNDPVEKSAHDKIVALVESMLGLHKSLASAQSPLEKERLEKQIKATDDGIDKLVYELYGLNQEEIRIVES